jgi:Protein of unknown function (DUF3429)
MSSVSAPNALAKRLGYAGLAPFILLPALLWITKTDQLAALLWIGQAYLHSWLAMALTSYAALIATFLGGIHWGIAGGMANDIGAGSLRTQRNFHLIWGVTPSLIAWIGLIMPAHAGLPLIAALLMACYFVDRSSYAKAGWSAWLPMRLQLTIVATLSCLIGAGTI